MKKLLKVEGMIELLKRKNIKFNYMSEKMAVKYLQENNNYYNLSSYKNNFQKYYVDGKPINKYIDLDFAYLKDLSEIDDELKQVLFDMITWIEKSLKLKILNKVESIEQEDGYKVVNMYLESDFKGERRVHNSIIKKIGKEEYKDIFKTKVVDINKRLKNIAIWEFLEIITFGELVDFYDFYTKEYNLKEEYKYVFILRDVVRLRNAVCHNTCILNDLGSKDNHYHLAFEIVYFLKFCNVNEKNRKIKPRNSRIRQITCTLYLFNEIVINKKIKAKVTKKLNKFFYNRIIRNKNYYNNNELLKSIYEYFFKIIEKYFKLWNK